MESAVREIDASNLGNKSFFIFFFGFNWRWLRRGGSSLCGCAAGRRRWMLRKRRRRRCFRDVTRRGARRRFRQSPFSVCVLPPNDVWLDQRNFFDHEPLRKKGRELNPKPECFCFKKITCNAG